jgi:hypothetical protein
MNKYFLGHLVNEKVEFTTTYNFSGKGEVVIMGNGKPGISSGPSIIPCSDIKHVRRLRL